MSGLAVRVIDERMGIRVNSAESLKLLFKVIEKYKLTWDQLDEPVEILYSLRVAPPIRRKGVRNYHLLYLAAGEVIRTLDEELLTRRLEESLWSVSALSSPDKVVLPGWTLKTTKGLTLLPVVRDAYEDIKLRLEPSEAKIIAKEFVLLNSNGEFVSENSAHKIDQILFDFPIMTPSETLVKLMQTLVSPIPPAMPILTQLSQTRVLFEGGPDCFIESHKISRI